MGISSISLFSFQLKTETAGALMSPSISCVAKHFITYISGGLLYGHEVEFPAAAAAEEGSAIAFARRRALDKPRAVRRALSPRRTQVLESLLTGATYRQIAQRLGLSIQTVNYHAQQIYREHGLRVAPGRKPNHRAALAAKLGRPLLQPRQRPRTQQRMVQR